MLRFLNLRTTGSPGLEPETIESAPAREKLPTSRNYRYPHVSVQVRISEVERDEANLAAIRALKASVFLRMRKLRGQDEDFG